MADAVKRELTGTRDLSYSKWHRTLKKGCYATDLDWIEVRSDVNGDLEIVAFIEAKSITSYMTNFQSKVYGILSARTGIPYYEVQYSDDLSTFIVRGEGFKRTMSEPEYRAWLEELGSERLR